MINKLKSFRTELISFKMFNPSVGPRWGDLLCWFYSLRGRENHHETVEEDGDDDDEREEGMNKDMDGHTADGREGWKKPHGVLSWESKYVLSFANHNKRLKRNPWNERWMNLQFLAILFYFGSRGRCPPKGWRWTQGGTLQPSWWVGACPLRAGDPRQGRLHPRRPRSEPSIYIPYNIIVVIYMICWLLR